MACVLCPQDSDRHWHVTRVTVARGTGGLLTAQRDACHVVTAKCSDVNEVDVRRPQVGRRCFAVTNSAAERNVALCRAAAPSHMAVRAMIGGAPPSSHCGRRAPSSALQTPPMCDHRRGPTHQSPPISHLQGCIGRGGGTRPPPSRLPSLCPATVSRTASASLNGICNRKQPPPTACLTACPGPPCASRR